MIDKSKHRPSDKQAYRFLQLLLEASAKTAAPRPEELTTLTNQLSALRSQGQAPPLDDPFSLYRFMDLLRRKGNPRMSDLGRALSVSLSTATRMAEVLVDTGYAERLSDPSDRRLVRLTLTDHGKKAHDVIERFLLQSIRKNLDFLTPEEQAVFLALADKVTAAIRRDAAHQE
jgi:DNA-binding MarR family transcriptional regulator